MARSCSSLVWGGVDTEGCSSVAVVVDETLVVAMAMVMFPHRRMSSLLCLYL